MPALKERGQAVAPSGAGTTTTSGHPGRARSFFSLRRFRSKSASSGSAPTPRAASPPPPLPSPPSNRRDPRLEHLFADPSRIGLVANGAGLGVDDWELMGATTEEQSKDNAGLLLDDRAGAGDLSDFLYLVQQAGDAVSPRSPPATLSPSSSFRTSETPTLSPSTTSTTLSSSSPDLAMLAPGRRGSSDATAATPKPYYSFLSHLSPTPASSSPPLSFESYFPPSKPHAAAPVSPPTKVHVRHDSDAIMYGRPSTSSFSSSSSSDSSISDPYDYPEPLVRAKTVKPKKKPSLWAHPSPSRFSPSARKGLSVASQNESAIPSTRRALELGPRGKRVFDLTVKRVTTSARSDEAPRSLHVASGETIVDDSLMAGVLRLRLLGKFKAGVSMDESNELESGTSVSTRTVIIVPSISPAFASSPFNIDVETRRGPPSHPTSTSLKAWCERPSFGNRKLVWTAVDVGVRCDLVRGRGWDQEVGINQRIKEWSSPPVVTRRKKEVVERPARETQPGKGGEKKLEPALAFAKALEKARNLAGEVKRGWLADAFDEKEAWIDENAKVGRRQSGAVQDLRGAKSVPSLPPVMRDSERKRISQLRDRSYVESVPVDREQERKRLSTRPSELLAARRISSSPTATRGQSQQPPLPPSFSIPELSPPIMSAVSSRPPSTHTPPAQYPSTTPAQFPFAPSYPDGSIGAPQPGFLPIPYAPYGFMPVFMPMPPPQGLYTAPQFATSAPNLTPRAPSPSQPVPPLPNDQRKRVSSPIPTRSHSSPLAHGGGGIDSHPLPPTNDHVVACTGSLEARVIHASHDAEWRKFGWLDAGVGEEEDGAAVFVGRE
ncbi:hypothetical protein MNV49_006003 [Pseudohyphozyma bogoriensis]|nr:hypothetical protein MNV49_006003 [Pseudohyphozyma bogoriensis]